MPTKIYILSWFLDTLLHRQDDGSVKTTVYRKPTHTDQYLNFSSNHPLQHKRSVIQTLLHRADVLVTDGEDQDKEREHVRQALKVNGYPAWMFDSPSLPQRVDPAQREKVGVSIPYVKGVSERLARVFRQHGTRVFHKPTNTLRSRLTRAKDKTEDNKKCGVIYEVKCGDCSETYIGETARPLGTRLKEHQSRANSAVCEHLCGQNHIIGESSVIGSEQHGLKRKVKEAIHIKQRRPSLNRDTGMELPPIYNSVLRAPVSAPTAINTNLSAENV